MSSYQETIVAMRNFAKESGVETQVPNGIKVSDTDSPMFIPASNSYLIGSSEIVAMCSNAVAVGTGQTGDAPLYVFCKDGIYALFVDSSGQLTYTNARVIARDVCNNAKSVTPIDEGVVFTTDRGLMMIAGNEVVEIGQPLEGDYCKFAVIGNLDFNRICKNAYSKALLAGLSEASLTQTDFLDYLKHAIVAYNHNERELMICNILKKATGRLYYDYMYVLDRNGNWTRRDYNAEQFVENYPVTFRVADGKVYQMDERSDAHNGIFALSNVVKLDSIGFKAVDRVVARGVFDTIGTEEDIQYEAYNVEGRNPKTNVPISGVAYTAYAWDIEVPTPDGCTSIDVLDVKFSGYEEFCEYYGFSPEIHVYEADGSELEYEDKPDDTRVYSVDHPTITEDGTVIIRFQINNIEYEAPSELQSIFKTEAILLHADIYDAKREIAAPYVGIYAFGSYDGRTWACLGHTERKGNFTDLGCNVERTDCKFFRFLVAGQIKKESRLDYFEISERASRLSTKIR